MRHCSEDSELVLGCVEDGVWTEIIQDVMSSQPHALPSYGHMTPRLGTIVCIKI
ncbi:hypothetical protein SCLCIDRAFT_769892 [Scleroderma citrinum Foug A]|uniref:Uncharacterized protein n=1 Tax=Scleroderma citrinum Foug A TaxID=1036808 RepID=A0A0C3DR89_9AGAM|nr:hypothetical protein SCLCIDRAFT_769892 [Scleroderma citrinum Foug A]